MDGSEVSVCIDNTTGVLLVITAALPQGCSASVTTPVTAS